MSWSELHFYQDGAAENAAMNMAIDEALLEFVQAPSLRIYNWKQPSLSFGYFGAFAEVEHETKKRDLVRRWTGGGIVFHGADLTYSFILPAKGREPLPPAREIYLRVHEAIRRALSSHLSVDLAAENAPKISGACFANPVAADVMSEGKKIAGAAQRRTRLGLLQQGSIQLASLPASFAETFARELSPNFTRKEFPARVLSHAEDLATGKYGADAWLRQR